MSTEIYEAIAIEIFMMPDYLDIPAKEHAKQVLIDAIERGDFEVILKGTVGTTL